MITDVEWMRHAAKFFGGFLVSWCLGSGARSPLLTPTKHASGLLAGILPRACSVSCLARCPRHPKTLPDNTPCRHHDYVLAVTTPTADAVVVNSADLVVGYIRNSDSASCRTS